TALTSYSCGARPPYALSLLDALPIFPSATTLAAADTQAPTVPTNLVATASSSTQIGLTWTASTDNVAVTGYRIERCSGTGCSSFAQIQTTDRATPINHRCRPPSATYT